MSSIVLRDARLSSSALHPDAFAFELIEFSVGSVVLHIQFVDDDPSVRHSGSQGNEQKRNCDDLYRI